MAVAPPAKKIYSTHKVDRAEFIVDAVLFDMDGTLVDSIGAVETAWGNVAKELGKDPQEVIDATHGRRATDNLKDLKPELAGTPDNEMAPHVQEFEEKILEAADEFQNEVRSRRQSMAEEIRTSRSNSRRASQAASRRGSQAASRRGSVANTPPTNGPVGSRKSSFAAEVTKRLAFSGLTKTTPLDAKKDDVNGASSASSTPPQLDEDPFEEDSDDEEIDLDTLDVDTSDLVDRSVKILPGVRRIIDSIPEGRYAVATSGASTYCYGALQRVGIIPPKVTITADDPRLKRGKPHPDPFILAAKELGYDPKKCLVMEDSPSGIRAGVASGAKVIAICTSHPVEKINRCGTSYIVPDLEYVTIHVQQDGRLKVIIDSDPITHDATAALSKARDELNDKMKELKVNEVSA